MADTMNTAGKMSTADVARELVALCQKGQNMEAINKFYSPDIVSVESYGTPEMPATMKGMDAIHAKNTWWVENNEVHSAETVGPYMADEDKFAVEFKYDVTFKPTGMRNKMHEMALYTVQDGKVVHEHFFYTTQSPQK